jgi:hypothetical protein
MLGVRIILMHMQFALHGIEHPILAETGSEIICLLGGRPEAIGTSSDRRD